MNWFLIIKIVKKTYRQSLINQRNALNADEVMSLSSKIVTNFLQSPEAIKISTLASYKAINKEVNLDQLSEERSQKFKILTFPVIGANHNIDLAKSILWLAPMTGNVKILNFCDLSSDN